MTKVITVTKTYQFDADTDVEATYLDYVRGDLTDENLEFLAEFVAASIVTEDV